MIAELRAPTRDEFQTPTSCSLSNAFPVTLKERQHANPARFDALTMVFYRLRDRLPAAELAA